MPNITPNIFSNITKTASAYAKCALPNAQFIEKYAIDTTSEWIETMTGITQRYFVEDISQLEELATQAAQGVLTAQGGSIDINNVDGIIVASSTSSYNFPGLSQFVHKNLGLKNSARAIDINAACNGFMLALSIADSWIKHEGAENVIVVGAEAMSTILDMSDRSTCCLFGDGAGAVLLSKSTARGLLAFEHMVLSQRCDTLIAPKHKHICMNGRAVFENSIKAFEEVILNALKKADVKLEDVDLFILHQANARIFQALAKKMNLDEAKIPFFAKHFANTSAATIPMALTCAEYEKHYANKTIVLAGFGAGFTTTASVLSSIR